MNRGDDAYPSPPRAPTSSSVGKLLWVAALAAVGVGSARNAAGAPAPLTRDVDGEIRPHVDGGELAEQRLQQDESDERPSFRVEAQTVLLQVSVVDEEGAPVGGLERHDFSVFEDGVSQEITYFEHQQSTTDAVPTAIALLIDTSSSMSGGELAEVRTAALRFLKEAPAHAEIAVLRFDDEPSLVHDFTRDRLALAEAVRGIDAGGGTALYDGLLHAVELLDSSGSRRQSLVVLSDGKDLDSRSRFTDVHDRLGSSQTVVYSVGFYSSSDRALYVGSGQHFKPPPVEVNLNPAWVLIETARISGGATYFPNEASGLEPLFSEIGRSVRLQYLLAYSPPPADGERRFRNIQVRVHRAPAETETLTVRARRGYVR